jgi:hypothetical protein
MFVYFEVSSLTRLLNRALRKKASSPVISKSILAGGERIIGGVFSVSLGSESSYNNGGGK